MLVLFNSRISAKRIFKENIFRLGYCESIKQVGGGGGTMIYRFLEMHDLRLKVQKLS